MAMAAAVTTMIMNAINGVSILFVGVGVGLVWLVVMMLSSKQ